MILPQTQLTAVLLMVFSMLCLAGWIGCFKRAGKWRFELFYYDFVVGAALAAVVAAFTFGSLGFDGFLFQDDLMRAGKRSLAFGLAGGAIFNLGNMLLVGAVSVAGVAVVFPISLGLGLIGAAIWNYSADPQRNLAFLVLGVALVVAGMILAGLAHHRTELARALLQIKAGRAKSTVPQIRWKGVALAAASGVVMAGFPPLVSLGMLGDAGLGPYAMATVFVAGMFLSTFVYNLVFMNLPIQGQPVEILDYARGGIKNHVYGVAGGVIWACGAIASLVTGYGTPAPLGNVHFGLAHGAVVLATLFGLLFWNEAKGKESEGPVRLILLVTAALLAGGVTLLTMALVVAG
jgi:glucose uptake protein